MIKVDEDKFREAVEFGYSAKQLMEKFGISAYDVSYTLKALGINIVTAISRLREDKDLVIDLYLNEGLTAKQIAAKWTYDAHKVSRHNVSNCLRDWGVTRIHNAPKELKHLPSLATHDITRDVGEIGVMLIKRKSGKHHVIMDADEYLKLTSNA
jgi:transposase